MAKDRSREERRGMAKPDARGKVRFLGETGRVLWERVREHAWLLENVADLESPNAERRSVAQARMATFLFTAAFGYYHINDKEYEHRSKRFEYLARLNPDIFQFSWSNRERIAVFGKYGAGSLGRILGVSMVLPLTEKGYEAYTSNEVMPHEFREAHIVVSPYKPHTVDYVMIGGAVSVLCIKTGEIVSERRSPSLMMRMIDQVARFIPRFRVSENAWGGEFVEGDSPGKLPVVLCPLSEKNTTEQLVQRAGFEWDGYDQLGDKVYVFRVSDINDPTTTPDRRASMLSTAKMMDSYFE